MNLEKWLYRGGRPNRTAAVINRCVAAIHALGVAPNYLVTLDVRGRRSGRVVRAADGNVTLRHRRREEVRLEEIAADRRAPVLKAYLKRAPGARAHLPIHKDAPLSEFERVAARFPVFRVVA